MAAETQDTERRVSPNAQGERWGAAWAAMLGVFVLVVAEQLPIGLLTSMSSTLEVTEGVCCTDW